MKYCSDCGLEKSKTEFYRHESGHDGLRGNCISCHKAVHAEWMKENADKKRASDRDYHLANRDKHIEYAARHYQENIDERRAANRQWRLDNPEKTRALSRRRRQEKGDDVRAARRQHYRDNKGTYVANARKREKRIKQATPSWSDLAAIEALYVRAEELTVRTGVRHSVDHYYPLKGKTMCGLHVPANLRIIPHIVNIKKSNTEPVVPAQPLCCAWPMAYPHDIICEEQLWQSSPPPT